ncbi:MAG TPA: ABC transporter permease subunit [Pirellulaceae bacterium]|nr:ABC transporter permease subunit [Pirellulaceae bacterium]
MNRALLRKCLLEAQWLFWACALAVFAFCWMRVWLISRLAMGQFKVVIETFREELDRFLPISVDALFSYTGRVAVTYDEAVVVLCVVIWSVSRGTDCVSGELGRGTMEMLLAQPISRLQVLLHQAAVTVGGVALLAAIVWTGTFVGIQTFSAKEEKPAPSMIASVLRLQWPPSKPEKPEFIYTPMREKVDPVTLLPGAVNLFSLGFFIAGLSTLVSACDRYRWRAIGIVVGIYIIQLVMKAVGVGVKEWQWLGYFTFFTAYEPQLLVDVTVKHPAEAWNLLRTTTDTNGKHLLAALGPLGFDAILVSLGLTAYVAAAVRFCTRDLPPPL